MASSPSARVRRSRRSSRARSNRTLTFVGHSEPQSLGGLFDRQPLDIPQHEHDAILLRQLLQRGFDQLPHLALLSQPRRFIAPLSDERRMRQRGITVGLISRRWVD